MKEVIKTMNVVFRPRRSGKTTELIKRAAEIDGQIITNTVPQTGFVQKQASELGLKIRTPISIRQFALYAGEITRGNIPVLVDDAEYCLQYLLNNIEDGNMAIIDTISINDDSGSL